MATPPIKTPILEINGVHKKFPRPESNGSYTVLEDVSVRLEQGDFVALLGRSGSGKSTLMRIAAGLIPATSGAVISSGKPVKGSNPDVAMVFQSFALLPWLTVVANVEIGLDNLSLTDSEREKRALDAIRMVGLEGFESAYPKELSGGMQQRVGFARAFVMRPRVLMLDEPFSALDVLTAENLRGEISDLWESGEFPANCVLMVTHNIEEAVLLADRVLIMGANPGHIRGELKVNLPRPRNRKAEEFRSMCDHIYTIMTNPESKVSAFGKRAPVPSTGAAFPLLPHARVGAISGLLELVEEYGGTDDVAVIASRLHLQADDLFPILDAAVMLGFAMVQEGDVSVTPEGHEFAVSDPEEAKEIFRKQVLGHVPLVTMMWDSLKQCKDGNLKADFFVDILDRTHSEEEALNQFRTAVDWGRYAGLFEFDSDEDLLQLPEEEIDFD